MRDQDFTKGYDQGKRAIKWTTGWVAGLGSVVARPLADAIGEAAESARHRAAGREQERIARQVAHDERRLYLESRVAFTPPRRFGFGYLLLVFVSGILGVSVAYWSTDAGPGKWKLLLTALVIGALLGLTMTTLMRHRRVRRAKRELRDHIEPPVSGGGVVIVVLIFAAIWYLKTKQ